MSTNFVPVVPAGPSVGSHAPDLVLTGLETRTVHGEPRVLAFVQDRSFAHEHPEAIRALRTQLRGLGAELIVLSPTAVWSVRADDPVEQLGVCSGRLATDVAAAALLYGVPEGGDAVFVIDSRGIVRFTHRSGEPIHPACDTLAEALVIAGRAMVTREHQGAKEHVLFTRREWSVSCLVAGCAAALLPSCKRQHAPAEHGPPPEPAPAEVDVTLHVNGTARTLKIDPRASLLDTLRERLGLTGTKKGCDAGQCGSCTVLLGGTRVVSCLTLAVMAQGRDVTTIEGLASDGVLHPVQQAFVDHDGLQCGYCTPGQIISAVALLREGRATTDDEVREQMSGNLCRCGAYPNIVAAIQAARRPRG